MQENNERLTAVFTTVGAGVLIFFGSLWIVGCIISAGLNNEIEYLILFGMLFLMLITALIIYLRRALMLPKEELTTEMKKRSKKIRNSFRIVNIMQTGMIIVAVIILQSINRSDLIVLVISVIIGLHFFALVPVFNFKFDILIGAGMIIWALIVPVCFPLIGIKGNQNPYIWSTFISLGNGLILWFGSINRFYNVNKILIKYKN